MAKKPSSKPPRPARAAVGKPAEGKKKPEAKAPEATEKVAASPAKKATTAKAAAPKAVASKTMAKPAPKATAKLPEVETPETFMDGASAEPATGVADAPPAKKVAKPSKKPAVSVVAEATEVAPAAAAPKAADATGADAAAAPAAPPPSPRKPPVDMPPRRADGTITLAHSPDADDAFMFYALANARVDTEDRKYEHVLSDIQTLNEEAKKGTYDVTAVSFHAYPYVRHNYGLLSCGASFGDGYGPILVAKSPIRPNEVEGMTVALPGALTTATLVTKLWFGRAKIKGVQVPFDRVTDAVRSGLTRAGVLIHEGQLTYKEMGLVRVVDFGQWWSEQTEGLPLPLGGNGIRRDIPKPLVAKIALDLKRSIAYALGHREEALAYAMKFGRNLSKEKADKFVGMYVNDLTLDYGERGRQAVTHLLARAHQAGLLAEAVEPDFL